MECVVSYCEERELSSMSNMGCLIKSCNISNRLWKWCVVPGGERDGNFM